MVYALNVSQLDLFAEIMLPLLDDPKAFEGPPPACDAEAHDWSVAHDQRVYWRNRYASGVDIYRVAIICSNCHWVVGFG